jgi:glycosyltransferase involved in cell wall biosynthesis
MYTAKTSYKLSVCVVTYNHEKYIRDCLQSIVSQKVNFDYEIIIGNDCSTDNTGAIVDEFASAYPNIKVVPYQNNVGASPNLNYVHSLAQGKYVAHCDGDDVMLPGKLQQQVDFLEAYEDYSVVWHKIVYFNEKGVECIEPTRPGRANDVGETIDFGYALRVGTFAAHSSIMYRKSARITYNPDFYTLDMYYTLEYLTKGKGMVLNAVLGKYRIDSTSSVRKDVSQMRNACIAHWSHYLNKFPDHRADVFIFAFFQMLIDFKNRRSTWKNFFKLMIQSIGLFNLQHLVDTYKSTKYLRIPDKVRYSHY